MLLVEYPEYNPETDAYAEGSMEQSWYYGDGEVYCIVMADPNSGDSCLLYFADGGLIRWVDADGTAYDAGYRWSEMQGYYAHAKEQCDSIASR